MVRSVDGGARRASTFATCSTTSGLPLARTAMRSDNKSVRDLSIDLVAFKKTKHILRAAEHLRDLCHRLFYEVVWISGEQNPADLFTKAHAVAAFRAYLALLDKLDRID